MLEYTLEEAVELLRTNESNAKTTLKTLEEDVAFLRDQITTTEVNIARAHNLGVRRRQNDKDGKEGEEPEYKEGEECPSCWPGDNKACMVFEVSFKHVSAPARVPLR